MATKFTLSLRGKGCTHIQDYELPLTVLPRVGEIIDASKLLGWEDDVYTFFVLSVTYLATKDGLYPIVTARQWYKGLRHEELQTRGWLLPVDNDLLEYDELEFYPDKRR